MIFAVSLFVIGSAIAGAAQSMAMLIVGRGVQVYPPVGMFPESQLCKFAECGQGIGGGGIQMLTNLIISDIVPLRDRGTFMALLLVAVLVGTASSPFVGGTIVQHTTWRLVFLLNLPIGGLALFLVAAFLKVNYNKELSIKEKFRRIDYIGNAIFIGSIVAILIALTWGGTTYHWFSFRVIIPLVLGFVGLGAFLWYESSRFCLEPTMPPHLFKDRNTAAAFTLTFLYSLTLYWLVYYMPLYFQAVQGSTPSGSGVQLMPTVVIWVPFAQIGGRLVARFGRYRPLHHVGFALATTGMGCMTLLRRSSPTGAWAGFQALIAAGLGLASSTLPAVLAALDEKDVATATGTWAFLRSFGIIWGVTLPAVVFNNQFDHFSNRISDPAVRAQLSNGQAYEHGTKLFIDSFQGALRDEIIGVYSDSLKTVWQVGTGVAGLGFLVVFLEKEIKLRTTLNTKFGMSEKKNDASKTAEP
jgi:MFS family permease